MDLEEEIVKILKKRIISGEDIEKDDYQKIYDKCEEYNLYLKKKILKNIEKANEQHDILMKNNKYLNDEYEFEFIY